MKCEIVHVPGEPEGSLKVSTVDVLASKIEPKLANSIVRQLNQLYPLENLRHVKRVRRRIDKGEVELSVILCLSDEYKEDSEAIPRGIHQLITAYNMCPFKAKTSLRISGRFINALRMFQLSLTCKGRESQTSCPFQNEDAPLESRHAARSKEEWEEQNKIWPTSYHPSTILDEAATLSEGDLQMIFKYMKDAIQMTKLSYIGGEVLNAAVIVDPMHRQIIAKGYDQTYPRPSTQATIGGDGCNNGCGVTTESDESSSSELGNSSQNVAVRTFSLNKCSSKSAGVSCLNPWGWTSQKSTNQNSMSRSKSKYTWHPLQHAALVAIENAAARDGKLFPGPGSSGCEPATVDNLLCTSDKSLSKRQRIEVSEEKVELLDHIDKSEEVVDKSESNEVLRPYLCTGFDIYLVWEPCTMCAMALVHQRIRRIFYALPNPHAGALGSVYRLHGQKSLNHHYSVFRVLIPEQDLELTKLNASDSSKEF